MSRIYNLHGVFLGTDEEVEQERKLASESTQMLPELELLAEPVFFTPEFLEMPEIVDLKVMLDETPISL